MRWSTFWQSVKNYEFIKISKKWALVYNVKYIKYNGLQKI